MTDELHTDRSDYITIGLLDCHRISSDLKDEIAKDALEGEDLKHGLNLLAEFHSHFCTRWMAQDKYEREKYKDGYIFPRELLRQVFDFMYIANEKNMRQTTGRINQALGNGDHKDYVRDLHDPDKFIETVEKRMPEIAESVKKSLTKSKK